MKMSEFLYEESVFDDSSDLEESWAGENVTFDASPASRKYFFGFSYIFNEMLLWL